MKSRAWAKARLDPGSANLFALIRETLLDAEKRSHYLPNIPVLALMGGEC
jgi:hypothetical protein